MAVASQAPCPAPCPVSAARARGSVATRVLPSPVWSSTTERRVRRKPARICTSWKVRPRVCSAARRTRAYRSGRAARASGLEGCLWARRPERDRAWARRWVASSGRRRASAERMAARSGSSESEARKSMLVVCMEIGWGPSGGWGGLMGRRGLAGSEVLIHHQATKGTKERQIKHWEEFTRRADPVRGRW